MRRLTGQEAEDYAIEFLKKKSFEILDRNYRIPAGEIDIIAQDKNEIVFVEVKYLTGNLYFPEEQITVSKQRKLVKAALSYMQKVQKNDSFRFDVLAISPSKDQNIDFDVYHIEDALQVNN